MARPSRFSFMLAVTLAACLPPAGEPDAGPDDAGDPCPCEFRADMCEAAQDQSTDPCQCDRDCDGAAPCGDDGECDPFCDPGGACVDPDCDAEPNTVCGR